MSDKDQEHNLELNWVHLPPGAETMSLWDSLHDGELVALRSDLLQRSLAVEFRVWHLVDFHGLPEDLSFVFDFVNVTSVRATRWEKWPGEIRELKGLPNAEQSRLVEEYQAKWREESDSPRCREDRKALPFT